MTGDQIDDFFGDLRDYPGKKKPVGREQPKPVPPEREPWFAKPRHHYVNGVKTEFFAIGQVALALNRSPSTIRLWERRQWIPPARFRAPAPRRSKVKEAGDRLWTRPQVEAMVRAAEEEGILDGGAPTRAFTAKVVHAFLALQEHTKRNTT